MFKFNFKRNSTHTKFISAVHKLNSSDESSKVSDKHFELVLKFNLFWDRRRMEAGNHYILNERLFSLLKDGFRFQTSIHINQSSIQVILDLSPQQSIPKPLFLSVPHSTSSSRFPCEEVSKYWTKFNRNPFEFKVNLAQPGLHFIFRRRILKPVQLRYFFQINHEGFKGAAVLRGPKIMYEPCGIDKPL